MTTRDDASATTPRCAICRQGGRAERTQLVLAGGVAVWLCATHRSEAFQRRRDGRDLTESLRAVWLAAGCLTARRERALEAHLRRVTEGPRSRGRPGSYTWLGLRRQAEALWASGMPPGQVIDDLRAAVCAELGPGGAAAPSRGTMARWYREGRWREAI
jgi:hypothetical protein